VFGDQLLDRASIIRAHGRYEIRYFGIDGFRGSVFLYLDTEVGPLIDPGAQDSDLVFGERTSRRHLQSAVAVHQAPDKLAFRALARNDNRPVVTAPKGVLALVEPKAGLLHFVTVAGVTLLGKDRLHIFFEVNLDVGGRGELGLSGRQDSE